MNRAEQCPRSQIPEHRSDGHQDRTNGKLPTTMAGPRWSARTFSFSITARRPHTLVSEAPMQARFQLRGHLNLQPQIPASDQPKGMKGEWLNQRLMACSPVPQPAIAKGKRTTSMKEE